jgi:hypothetical protein
MVKDRMFVCNAPCGSKIPCIIVEGAGIPSDCAKYEAHSIDRDEDTPILEGDVADVEAPEELFDAENILIIRVNK